MYFIHIDKPLPNDFVGYGQYKGKNKDIAVIDKLGKEYPYELNGEDVHVLLPKGFEGYLYLGTGKKKYELKDVWGDYQIIK